MLTLGGTQPRALIILFFDFGDKEHAGKKV